MPSQPYIGNIIMFGGTFAPVNWAVCDGSTMSIAQNETLFQLIGTTYGGDGVNTFNLPDLRGRLPIHAGNFHGNNYVQGQLAGTETVTLTTSQMPSHTHAPFASKGGAPATNPSGAGLSAGGVTMYNRALDAPVALAPQAVAVAGGSQPHNNLQPYLCVTFCIALFGIFPSQG